MSFKPFRNNILVEEVEKEQKSVGGVILTSSSGEKLARVLAVGQEVENVAVGDLLYVNWRPRVTIEFGPFAKYVISEEHVYGRESND